MADQQINGAAGAAANVAGGAAAAERAVAVAPVDKEPLSALIEAIDKLNERFAEEERKGNAAITFTIADFDDVVIARDKVDQLIRNGTMLPLRRDSVTLSTRGMETLLRAFRLSLDPSRGEETDSRPVVSHP